MATRKQAKSRIDTSRLRILATGDEAAFREYIVELLASGDRLAREAALEALLERPLLLRAELGALYDEVDSDGPKLDQGCPLRGAIVQILDRAGDLRDAPIAIRAAGTFEKILGEDVSWRLRTYGLRLLARVKPDLYSYIAGEHLDANYEKNTEVVTAVIQLLAATGQHAQVYQWLVSGVRPPEQIAAAFEVLSEAPPEVTQRYANRVIEVALRTENERLALAVAETIIERELEGLYSALASLLSTKITNELYSYIALLMAGTNRPELIGILEEQLYRGRRPKLVADALRVRTTPEQAAILKRWAEEHG
jgi:hypothetical protein